MKILRFILVMVVIGYAGWLAWPFISPFLEGAGPETAAARSGAVVALDSGGDLPTAALWIGAVVLYLVSALLLGAGNPRAVVAYFLGFLADIVLRLAMSPDRGVSADIAARSAEAVPAPAGLGPAMDRHRGSGAGGPAGHGGQPPGAPQPRAGAADVLTPDAAACPRGR
ncbi:hypothetical protein [Brevundimonas denitrificans]|uniref:hypothetical protein n=1 Tax=Brevundimonas denitrificans TaxID=1443434 RepID=UPI00223AEBB1|nr:hypothetical protein [Brevundimonas denitrificans]